ncbi:MAG: phospholipid carrier-dependent glycosyltransferase [Myxococcota bacterium]|nr:phospholipid carrier-dependent glycosyltransferase [Myxococcota bacterium]
MPEPAASPRLRAAVWVAAAVLLLTGLGATDVNAPDEPRYAQVAEEMRAMEHGLRGLVVLHLGGEVYTQKPPLYYGLAALLGAPGGRVGEWAARLPSALAGILLVGLVLRFGHRLLGGASAVLGAALLLTAWEYAYLARRAQLDVLLALFETLALAGFWSADRGLAARGRSVALAHGAMGLAVLTKGPVGFLLPVLSMTAFLAWEGRLRDLRRLMPPWAFLLSVAPGLAWITAATALAPQGFADEAVGTNLIGRFFAGTSHERPFYYFFYQFPADFLPWTLLLPVVAWAAARRIFGEGDADEPTRRAWRFLLAWFGASFVFFSISSGKRGLYLLPAFPAAALLTADATLRWLAGRAAAPRALAVGAGLFGALLAAVGAIVVLAALGRPEVLDLLHRAEVMEEVHRAWALAFGIAVVSVVIGAVAAWLVLARMRSPTPVFTGVLVAGAFGIELAVFGLLFPAIEPIDSTRPIAEAATAVTPPGQPVGLVGDASMTGGLLYYGHRPVANLKEPEDVARFLAEGGRTLVVKRRKLERVTVVTPVEVVSSARTGRREVVVVRPAAVGDAAAGPGDDAPEG